MRSEEDLHRDVADRFIDVFRAAALQAGAAAKRLQPDIRLHNKEGATPESAALTAVDLAAQDVLLLALHGTLPGVAMDAEEDTETVSLFAPEAEGRPLVVVDPIDGTLNYSRGSREYAVMGALITDGRYLATVVHFPAWDETYWAQRGRGCWRRRGKLDPERVQVSDSGNVVLASPRVPTSWRESLSQAGFDVSVSRCSAVDSALPATARGIASVTRHRPDRRRALPLLLTTEAGGVVTWGERPWEGEDPRVDGEGPCVAACSRAIADRVRDAVAAAAR